jgi:AcrR family transcriptional regulator
MKSNKPKGAPKGRGRPRSEQAKKDILKAAYRLLKNNGFRAIGYHEIAQAAGVSSATLHRWWSCKEEILFEACFEHMKPIMAVSESGSALMRLYEYVLRATDFLVSANGTVMSRLFCGINENKKLHNIFLEKYVVPRRKIQGSIIKEAIASGELKQDTDPELLIDALNGPLFFRWLQGHAPLDKGFAQCIFEKVIPSFKKHAAQGPRMK